MAWCYEHGCPDSVCERAHEEKSRSYFLNALKVAYDLGGHAVRQPQGLSPEHAQQERQALDVILSMAGWQKLTDDEYNSRFAGWL